MARPTWVVVAHKEIKEAWLGGRALALLLAYAIFLSVLTFLLASDKELSLLAQRDAASLSIQLAIIVGALLAMIASADAVSGERERSTLEGLLTAPGRRRDIIIGKAIAGASLWLGAYVVLVPYVLVLTHDAGIVNDALLLSFLLGGLLSVTTIGVGVVTSALSSSNRTSLSVSLFLFLLVAAPTQLPPTTLSGSVGQAILRANPMTVSAKIIDAILANNHTWADQVAFLLSPLLCAVAALVALLTIAPRRLTFERRERA